MAKPRVLFVCLLLCEQEGAGRPASDPFGYLTNTGAGFQDLTSTGTGEASLGMEQSSAQGEKVDIQILPR
jgi:hypothetical protein